MALPHKERKTAQTRRGGAGWRENESYTLNTVDRHAVCYEPKSALEENWAESEVKTALRAEASKQAMR